MKTKNTKKLGVIIVFIFTLLILTSSVFARCSLTNLRECGRSSLLVFIVQLLSNQKVQTLPETDEVEVTTVTSTISGIPTGFQFTKDLKKGSRNIDVKYLQILLNSDPDTSIGNAGKETNYFGNDTKTAVIKFQNKYASEILTPVGLTRGTGVFGYLSRVKANSILNSTTSTPVTCTFWDYSSWSACSNNQQTRTVLTSYPSGCINGSPVISQSCTSTPVTCTSWDYSSWSACSNNQQTRTVLTSYPSGCINGSPVISQSCTSTPVTCTSWDYSEWESCANGQQARAILSSYPSGCVNGNPITTRSCTTTCTSWDYSAWGTCSSSGQQTRGILASYPTGCINGSPIISQSCTPTPTTNEIQIPKAYITAYTWFDNTPPGSSAIALPVIHQYASGIGTYTDPITIAVGHVISGGNDTPDYPAGTIFYIPNVRAYFIVEDLCGDGNTPQNIPCHNLSQADPGATTWIDMWIDGQSGTNSSTTTCAENLTGLHLVIQNPASNYAVVTGPIFQNGQCRQQYGNTLVNQ
jgi:hypothetical protein